MSQPLSRRQQRAAALIGSGRLRKDVARELGVTGRTISRWTSEREDFRELVRQHREAVLEERPTAHATLEAALSATTPNGSPDWSTRVSAAKALYGFDQPARSDPIPVETIIHTEALESGDGDTD